MSRAIVAAVAAVLLSGCSILLVEGPRGAAFRAPGDPVVCTDKSLAPKVDFAWGALNASVAGLALTDNTIVLGTSQEDRILTNQEKSAVVVAGLVWAAAMGYSWNEGNKRLKECRAAKGVFWNEYLRDRMARDTVPAIPFLR